MVNKNENFSDFSVAQAMKLANSEAGKQLLARLQQENGQILQQAMAQASGGNLTDARNTVSRLLSDPETMKLLQQLKG